MPLDQHRPVPFDAKNPPSPQAKRTKLRAGDHGVAVTLQKYLGWFSDPGAARSADTDLPQMFGQELQRAFGEISVAGFAPEARPAARLVIETLASLNVLMSITEYLADESRLPTRKPQNIFFQISNLATVYGAAPQYHAERDNVIVDPAGNYRYHNAAEKREAIKQLALRRDMVIDGAIAAAVSCVAGFAERHAALKESKTFVVDGSLFVSGPNISPPSGNAPSRRSDALWQRPLVLTRCHLRADIAAALTSLSAHTCEATGGKLSAAPTQAFLVAFAPAQPRDKIRRTLWPSGIYMVKRSVINQLSLLDSTDAEDLLRRSTRFSVPGNFWARFKACRSGLY
jgi:hypothetical protein